MQRALLLSSGFLALFLTVGLAQADQMKFNAVLAPGPGVTSSGKGTATASLDTATKTLMWDVDYSGLSGPATAAHIHGPADPGANAPIVVPFTGNLASPIKGSATLTDAQIAQLEAGKWYVNIHTEANKPGESAASWSGRRSQRLSPGGLSGGLSESKGLARRYRRPD